MSFDYHNGHLVAVGDAQIYIEETGDPAGEPLLLLPGGLGNLHDFDAIVAGLPQHLRIMGMDWRGHGRSTRGSAALSYAQHEADVLAVLDALGIKRVGILGFSDGGIVGYRLAAAAPARVRRLVTLGAQWRLEPGDPSIPLLQGLTRADWQARFPEAIAQYERLNPQPDFDALLTAVQRLWSDTSASGYPGESVRRMGVPTLLVRGDGDPFLSLAEAAALQERVAGAGLLNLPFVGHAAHEEATAVFLAVVCDFLCLPPPSGQVE